MLYSLDRFEGDTAVLVGDDGRQRTLPRVRLPAAAREGDVLALENGAWQLCPHEAERRRRRAAELLGRLQGPGE